MYYISYNNPTTSYKMAGLLLFIQYFLIIFAPENMSNKKLRSMKKVLFVCSMIVASLTASAQFTVYQPVEVPRTSYTPSPGYGTPFTIYEPVYGNPYQQRQQQAKPKMQEVTLRGYYKKGNDWYSTPIRVGVIGEEVRLLSTKTQYGWSNCSNKASEVGAWDSEEIRDNFNYKAYTTLYGTVYF